MGIKENTKTHNETINGEVKNVKEIVTSGREFIAGLRIIKVGREIFNYFTGSPQRKEKLESVVTCFNLPSITVTNYPDTRVAFVSKLFGTLLANHYAFKIVGHENFAKVFDKLTPTNWNTMQEMEAICLDLAGYAVNEAQSSGAFISSLRPYFCLAILDATKKKRFKVMDMNRHPWDTKLHHIKKVIKRVEEFTEGGKRCFARLKEQIEIRLPVATTTSD